MGFRSGDELVQAATVNGGRKREIYQKTYNILGGLVAGGHYLSFTQGGFPAAAVYSGVARELTQVISGPAPTHPGINFGNAAANRKNFGILQFLANALAGGVTGELLLVDVVAYYLGVTTGGSFTNTLTNPVGLPRHTTGERIYCLVDVTSTLGGTDRTLTLTYTNSDNVAGRVVSFDLQSNTPVSVIAHRSSVSPFPTYFAPLASGDKGIRSIQTANLNASMGGGVVSLVLFKVLSVLSIGEVGVPQLYPEGGGINPLDLEELPDGHSLHFIFTPSASLATVQNFTGVTLALEGPAV